MSAEPPPRDTLRSAWDARQDFWQEAFGPMYLEIRQAHLAARTSSLPLETRRVSLRTLEDVIRQFIAFSEPYTEPDGLDAALDAARAEADGLMAWAAKGSRRPPMGGLGGGSVPDPAAGELRMGAALAGGADALFNVFRKANAAAAKAGIQGPVVRVVESPFRLPPRPAAKTANTEKPESQAVEPQVAENGDSTLT